MTTRAFALVLVAFASLQLALRAAYATFLFREGRGSADSLPMVLMWLGAVVAGLALYALGRRIRD